MAQAIGPDDVGGLMSSLDAFASTFKETWAMELEASLQNGECTVVSI
jgi:hypothetical protein